MFRNKNLATSNQIIDSLLDSGQLEKREGAIVLHRKAGRKTISTGTIFLRDSFIYAVHIDTMETPIARRVATAGIVDKEDLENVLRSAGSKETNPQIVHLLLERQLISNKVIDGFVKEHFIAQITEILSWDSVLGEWHPNSSTKNFVMPYVSFAKIREVIAKRLTLRHEFDHLTARFFRSDEVPSLTFTLTQKNIGDKSKEMIAVSKFCNNQSNIGDIAKATGLTEYNVFQLILVLWKEGLLTIHLGGIQVPYSSAQAAQNLALGKNVDDVVEDSNHAPIHIPGTEPEVEEAPVEEEPSVVFEEVPDEEAETIIDDIQEDEEVDDDAFNEQLNDIFAQDFPAPLVDPTLAEIAVSVEEEPTDTKVDEENTSRVVEEIPVNKEVKELAVNASTDEEVSEEPARNSVAISNEEIKSSEQHSEDEVEVDDEFDQLRKALEKVQEEFSDAVDVLNEAESARDDLASDKEALLAQLEELDKKLKIADENFDAAQQSYNEAYDKVQEAVNNFTFHDTGEA